MDAILLLGTNLGDRLHQLEKCREEITLWMGEIIKTSAIYATEPWGSTGQEPYYNQAIEVRVECSPAELMEKALSIEKKMGRIRLEEWGPRLIDIDIIYFEDQIISLPHLTIPHPLVAGRRFALTPLAEQWPDFVHPILNKTNRELEELCQDSLKCTRLD